MKNLYIVAFALTLLGACRTTPIATCELDGETRDALRVLIATDWDGTTPDVVAQIWPSSVTWGAEAAGHEPCMGTASFSNLERVVFNECVCCDTFAFTDVLRNGKCERYLSSVTLVRHVTDEASAREVATQFLAVLGSTQEVALRATTLTKQLSPTSTEVAQVEVTQALGGWQVRLMMYRATVAEE